MIKNRFNVLLTGKSISRLYFLRCKRFETELFKHELRRQNVFGQN
jgi:hypothetical protein